ncbi:hypothetical protein AB0F76_14850, partial [Streptomyces aureus]
MGEDAADAGLAGEEKADAGLVGEEAADAGSADEEAAGVRSAAGAAVSAGGSSRITCALVPLIPNALTPARRAR